MTFQGQIFGIRIWETNETSSQEWYLSAILPKTGKIITLVIAGKSKFPIQEKSNAFFLAVF